MNVKEMMELLLYLEEKRKDAIDMRNYYSEKLTETDSEHCKQAVAKYGTEVSQLNTFIRMIGQIEVTR